MNLPYVSVSFMRTKCLLEESSYFHIYVLFKCLRGRDFLSKCIITHLVCDNKYVQTTIFQILLCILKWILCSLCQFKSECVKLLPSHCMKETLEQCATQVSECQRTTDSSPHLPGSKLFSLNCNYDVASQSDCINPWWNAPLWEYIQAVMTQQVE